MMALDTHPVRARREGRIESIDTFIASPVPELTCFLDETMEIWVDVTPGFRHASAYFWNV